MKTCDCDKWKENHPKIISPELLAWVYGKIYDGEIFWYCPWCGKELVEEKADENK